MALLVARDSDAQGDLVAWWDGKQLEPDTQVTCDGDEMVVFLDGDEVVTTLGPGRHSLAPPPPELSDADELAVAFVTTRLTLLEAEGALEDLDNEGAEDVELTVTFTAAVQIADATKVMDLLDKLADEESLEDWLIDELVVHAKTAASESNRSLSELTSGAHSEELGEKTAQNAREVLAEYGVDIPRVGSYAISVPE